jgi:GcrA cell cycle regulator
MTETQPKKDWKRDWTDQELETLLRMVEKGNSYSFIAKTLNRSKNSCIGKAYRLKAEHPQPRHRSAGKKVDPKPKPKVVQAKVSRPRRERPTVIAATPVPDVMPVIPMTGAVEAIANLKPKTCKYPIGDPKTDQFRFCSKEIEDGVYCPQHKEVCYYDPKDRPPNQART